MNTTQFAARAARLIEVNAVVVKLDETIREKAFDVLSDYVTGGEEVAPQRSPADSSRSAGTFDEEKFYSAFSHDKPSDNALLIAAAHYAQHGAEPFTLNDIRGSAERVGLVVPERLDMTFKTFTREGKALFRSEERGTMRPTVNGELFLKKTYDVSKGSAKKNA